jgi:hypothetical protein
MKLLVVCSSFDLTQPFSATPAWWQLLKAFYEIGVEVIATPYQGPAIETLWWRAAPNPAQWYGDTFQRLRNLLRKAAGSKPSSATNTDADPLPDRLIRATVKQVITPLWARHLDDLLTREPDIDAVLILTAPLNHLVGIPAEIQRKHGKPVFYYDGDVPASLPSMAGFASGFRIYQGGNPSEYTALISNSQGGAAALKALGARDVHTVYYGADPDVFAPVPVTTQDIDVFFYGHGREYREQWVEAMLTQPAAALPQTTFAVRGRNLGDLGRVQTLPYLSFSKLREYACRSKLNLCITRGAHASVYASSSSRPFELSALGCCIVANTYAGIETWFEPGKEVIVVHSAEEAIEQYRWLLSHDSARQAIGAAARARLLAEHTFQHRAQQLITVFKPYL